MKAALERNLLSVVEPYWSKIGAAAARSLKVSSRGFLPSDMDGYLGCGVWGCAWPTRDKRFVVKVSLDATEGPHVALVMKHMQAHPGVAYYHDLWRLPSMVWTAEFGRAYVWVMLREEADVTAQYGSGGRAARGYAKVERVLDLLPEVGSELVYVCAGVARGRHPASEQTQQEKKVMRLARSLNGTPGEHVGNLVADAYEKKGIVLADTHFDNVGQRRHDLRKFGVPRHDKLVVTDLGSWDQCVITTDCYPKVKVL